MTFQLDLKMPSLLLALILGLLTTACQAGSVTLGARVPGDRLLTTIYVQPDLDRTGTLDRRVLMDTGGPGITLINIVDQSGGCSTVSLTAGGPSARTATLRFTAPIQVFCRVRYAIQVFGI